MAEVTGGRTPDPDVFASLTCEEMQILRDHLASGMTKQHYVTRDHATFMEMVVTCQDIHEAWILRWDAEHP